MQRGSIKAQFIYSLVLLRRLRAPLFALALLMFGGGTAMWLLFARAGKPIAWPKAVMAAYFLLFGQPILEVPDENLALQVLFMALPPLGIFTVAEGLVRFASLFFAREKDDKEWFAVLAMTLQDHVILVGGGRVGFRVFEQLTRLGVPLVVIERSQTSPLVAQIREAGVPVLVADARSPSTLQEANLARARALICCTDDDLANLNVALDARKQRPGIRVVLRLFDDDLVSRTRESFGVDSFSTSSLAAPALAVAALDPAITNSFDVGGRLMVVAEVALPASLSGRTVAQVREETELHVLHLKRAGGAALFDPRGAVLVEKGDVATVQGTLEAYRRVRTA